RARRRSLVPARGRRARAPLVPRSRDLRALAHRAHGRSSPRRRRERAPVGARMDAGGAPAPRDRALDRARAARRGSLSSAHGLSLDFGLPSRLSAAFAPVVLAIALLS